MRRHAERPRNIWEIIHRGGFPGLLDREVDWEFFFSSYVRTYLERDVREITAVQDLAAFRRFLVAVAARTGQVVNYTNIAREVEIDETTVKRWISILEASGVIYLLEPYRHSVLKRAIKTPKLYFRDTGLASYLTRWLTPQSLEAGAQAGAMFETWVVGEILTSYAYRGIDYRYVMSYYRGKDLTSQTSEIDVVIEADGVLYPIEIKKGAHPKAIDTEAFQVLDQIPEKRRGPGAVISLVSTPQQLREDVLTIPAWYI